MMAWGRDCSAWELAVDVASLEEHGSGQIPDENFVMTTCHPNESISEVFWHSHFVAHHPTIALPVTVIIHVSEKPNEEGLVNSYSDALLGDGRIPE